MGDKQELLLFIKGHNHFAKVLTTMNIASIFSIQRMPTKKKEKKNNMKHVMTVVDHTSV